MEGENPFNQLSLNDQKAVIDCAVAATLISVRLPEANAKTLSDYVIAEFSVAHQLPINLVRYAFRSLGRNLFIQDWTLTITKSGSGFTTAFNPSRAFGGDHETQEE